MSTRIIFKNVTTICRLIRIFKIVKYTVNSVSIILVPNGSKFRFHCKILYIHFCGETLHHTTSFKFIYTTLFFLYFRHMTLFSHYWGLLSFKQARVLTFLIYSKMFVIWFKIVPFGLERAIYNNIFHMCSLMMINLLVNKEHRNMIFNSFHHIITINELFKFRITFIIGSQIVNKSIL